MVTRQECFVQKDSDQSEDLLEFLELRESCRTNLTSKIYQRDCLPKMLGESCPVMTKLTGRKSQQNYKADGILKPLSKYCYDSTNVFKGLLLDLYDEN